MLLPGVIASRQVDFVWSAKQEFPAGVMLVLKLLLFWLAPVQLFARILAGIIEKSHTATGCVG